MDARGTTGLHQWPAMEAMNSCSLKPQAGTGGGTEKSNAADASTCADNRGQFVTPSALDRDVAGKL